MAAQEQEPAVQFAQRLASNERPVRSKALKKLRKYMAARSQKVKGAFTAEELLKLWKGLFYCLWMQDRPLLQEELCAQVSSLLHCLHNADVQFLFLDTFLQTINREWNGIDRLRMDKFYMLVRFVFRQTFEMLKRRDWDDGLVERFRELLSERVLHSTSEAPSGVQFHILDFFLEELGRVGAAELTAERNLTFIDPFCKAAAKTKNHTFMQAICSGILQEIVDQAPFAIEDLMRELLKKGGAEGEDFAHEDDSGQASAEDEEEVDRTAAPQSSKEVKGKHLNGLLPGRDDEDEDELSDLGEDFSYVLEDSESPGPMLQFDYKAVAERLLRYASRPTVSNFNRKKLYPLVKTFQGLSEGVFPSDGYPAEVSTDEDDYDDTDACAVSAAADEEPSSESPLMQKKKKKKNIKRKMGAEPPESTEEEPVKMNGDAQRGSRAKKPKKTTENPDIASSASTKKPQKDKSVAGGQANFASFQSPSVPVPLFCRTGKGSLTKQLFGTPCSESKKVTFGLKNNKTAEFRKTDRSLLVSPDGSSRVPFDPQQKPRFSVLKSPLGAQMSKKSHSTTKRRPRAADFF
ncbi:ribosomal RNA processing protein 1A-like [Scleropages formosus]|uniref:Ribosomal RNA processing protein 1A-like n=1 Tax=Scleropages formosus TaxID=113540 RepID=A0A0P7X7A0_SCLFO|nr:ribosomal RNA processing protein 1A-like [Scleropages formosus]